MIAVEKITSSSFRQLYEAFLHSDDPLSDEQDWRNVFDYQFANDRGYCGYAMLNGDELVGMIGMVFSDRFIAGASRKLCNLHTWWVREDHRGHSLKLFRPILGLTDCTVTHFTPCDTIRALGYRVGFRTLSSQLRILLPRRPSRELRARIPDLVYDSSAIESALDPVNLKIFKDHGPYRVGHMLFESDGRLCYVLYTHVVRHRLPYCHIHYVSDPQLFRRWEPAIRSSLLSRYRASFVALDTRLVRQERFERSFDFWAPAHAIYRSAELTPGKVDNLYSDVVFLKLTTLPDMSHALAQAGRKLLDAFDVRRRRPAQSSGAGFL